jgi:hypothetical protein
MDSVKRLLKIARENLATAAEAVADVLNRNKSGLKIDADMIDIKFGVNDSEDEPKEVTVLTVDCGCNELYAVIDSPRQVEDLKEMGISGIVVVPTPEAEDLSDIVLPPDPSDTELLS